MGDIIGTLIYYGLLMLLVALITAVIYRWIFRVNTAINNQQKQYMNNQVPRYNRTYVLSLGTLIKI